MRTRYTETITDPTTGEQLTFTADTEHELDEQINTHFGIDDIPATSPPTSLQDTQVAPNL